jgi:hypothetical protein
LRSENEQLVNSNEQLVSQRFEEKHSTRLITVLSTDLEVRKNRPEVRPAEVGKMELEDGLGDELEHVELQRRVLENEERRRRVATTRQAEEQKVGREEEEDRRQIEQREQHREEHKKRKKKKKKKEQQSGGWWFEQDAPKQPEQQLLVQSHHHQKSQPRLAQSQTQQEWQQEYDQYQHQQKMQHEQQRQQQQQRQREQLPQPPIEEQQAEWRELTRFWQEKENGVNEEASVSIPASLLFGFSVDDQDEQQLQQQQDHFEVSPAHRPSPPPQHNETRLNEEKALVAAEEHVEAAIPAIADPRLVEGQGAHGMHSLQEILRLKEENKQLAESNEHLISSLSATAAGVQGSLQTIREKNRSLASENGSLVQSLADLKTVFSKVARYNSKLERDNAMMKKELHDLAMVDDGGGRCTSRNYEELQAKFELLEQMYQPVQTENEQRKEMLTDLRKTALDISNSRLDLDIPTKRMGEVDSTKLHQLGVPIEDISLLQDVVCDPNFHPWRVLQYGGGACGENSSSEMVVDWKNQQLLALIRQHGGSGNGRQVAEEVLRCSSELQSWNPSGGYCVRIPYHHAERREMRPAELLKIAVGMQIPGCRIGPKDGGSGTGNTHHGSRQCPQHPSGLYSASSGTGVMSATATLSMEAVGGGSNGGGSGGSGANRSNCGGGGCRNVGRGVVRSRCRGESTSTASGGGIYSGSDGSGGISSGGSGGSGGSGAGNGHIRRNRNRGGSGNSSRSSSSTETSSSGGAGNISGGGGGEQSAQGQGGGGRRGRGRGRRGRQS